MWSEEELREIIPVPPAARRRSLSAPLRAEISTRGAQRMVPQLDELTRGESVIYAPRAGSHGNFIEASYRRILAHPDWSCRLAKAHSSKRQARSTGAEEEIREWRELDSATSSDALLMNIFCYPGVLHRRELRTLLGIDADCEPQFGIRSTAPLRHGYINTTELDMRIGDLLVEAKLTEFDFQFAPMHLLKRYEEFETIFDPARLEVDRRGVANYQSIRGVLAAHAASARFCVLCDARRPDLHEAWYAVIAAVRGFDLQSRLRIVTWQEIASCVSAPLRKFLLEKYGIDPA